MLNDDIQTSAWYSLGQISVSVEWFLKTTKALIRECPELVPLWTTWSYLATKMFENADSIVEMLSPGKFCILTIVFYKVSI